jgi:hypothetical protein
LPRTAAAVAAHSSGSGMGHAFRKSASPDAPADYAAIRPESMADVIVELEAYHGKLVLEYAAHVGEIEVAVRHCQAGAITRDECKAVNRQHSQHTARITRHMEIISNETSLYMQQITRLRPIWSSCTTWSSTITSTG